MKFCDSCGQGNQEEDAFCSNCGAGMGSGEPGAAEQSQQAAGTPPPPQTPPEAGFAAPPPQPGRGPGLPPPPPGQPRQPYGPQGPPAPYFRPSVPTDGMAIAALTLAVVSFLFCPVIAAVLALIFGYMSLRNIKDSGGSLTGEPMARAGIIISWVNLGLCALTGVFILIVVLVTIASN